MSVEIKDVRVILPALVSFRQNDQDYTVFVYVDQKKNDIVIPDTAEILDIEEFKASFAKYYNQKNPVQKTPVMPSKDIFNKINPNEFKGDFNERNPENA